MGEIVTVNEAVREKMNQAADLGATQFINSIRPIYGAKLGGTPLHIGTCLLVEWNDEYYLITAAHILDQNKETTLYVGVGGELCKLIGECQVTCSPEGKREGDHFDFAWMKLSESSLKEYKSFDYIKEHQMMPEHSSPGAHLHLALGYPNSKNKKCDNVNNTVTPKYMKYTSTILDRPELCREYGVSSEVHLFLGFDKKQARDEDGNIISALSPQGSSGGAFIDMGNVSHPDSFRPGHEPQGRLAGMVIQSSSKYQVLVAVRIHSILKNIT